MKVGTLTFHSADNLGAMLQAYALPEAVRGLGHDCEIIDYRCPAVTGPADLEWPEDLVRRYGPIKGLIKTANRWRLGWYDTEKRDVKFASFLRKNMPRSPKTYRHIREMTDLSYDAFLFWQRSELVTLVDKAALVCTGSFHCTAFSVLFGKRFYCCTPMFGISRVKSLLESVGLTERWVKDENLPREEADPAAAEEKLESLRRSSLTFLKNALEAEGRPLQ